MGRKANNVFIGFHGAAINPFHCYVHEHNTGMKTKTKTKIYIHGRIKKQCLNESQPSLTCTQRLPDYWMG